MMTVGHEEALELTPTSNPYLDFYNDFCKNAPSDIDHMFDPTLNAKRRKKLYKSLDVAVAMKYAWAIPDERALRIIKYFGPIVEIGAGTGYWGRLLQLRGVDIVCYDLHVADEEEDVAEKEEDEEQEEDNEGEKDQEEEEEEENNEGKEKRQQEEENDDESDSDDEEEEVEVEQIYWMDVKKGTPKILKNHSDRTLFLCYPDDFEDSEESMALECLNNYTGDTVIHVGEMLGQTLCLPDAWGRTSAPEFQVRLASVYHKVLQVPLPSWHSSMDTLTVWKRTKTSIMGKHIYAYIPTSERLDLVAACDETRHLLDENTREHKEAKKKRQRKN